MAGLVISCTISPRGFAWYQAKWNTHKDLSSSITTLGCYRKWLDDSMSTLQLHDWAKRGALSCFWSMDANARACCPACTSMPSYWLHATFCMDMWYYLSAPQKKRKTLLEEPCLLSACNSSSSSRASTSDLKPSSDDLESLYKKQGSLSTPHTMSLRNICTGSATFNTEWALQRILITVFTVIYSHNVKQFMSLRPFSLIKLILGKKRQREQSNSGLWFLAGRIMAPKFEAAARRDKTQPL